MIIIRLGSSYHFFIPSLCVLYNDILLRSFTIQICLIQKNIACAIYIEKR